MKLAGKILIGMLGMPFISHSQIYCKMEAEKMEIHNASLASEKTASGGKYVYFDTSGSIRSNCTLPYNGFYHVQIRYKAKEGEKESYFISNGKKIPIGLKMSEHWNLFSQPFYFNKGKNAFGLAKSWNKLAIDYISIGSFKSVPDIYPKHVYIYKNANRNLLFKVNNYGQHIHKITLDGKSLSYNLKPFPYLEYAAYINMDSTVLSTVSAGTHSLQVELDSTTLNVGLDVLDTLPQTQWVIMVPDVEHGSSVTMKTPSGKFILMDSGKDWVRDSIVIPFLHGNGIDTLDAFILTHYDHDHDSGDRGEKIKKLFHVNRFIDYDSVYTGETFSLDGLAFKILNSANDGQEENTKSVSMRISYKGFVYTHGADNYQVNQDSIITRFPEELKTNVFYGNHHFHGSVSPEYIIKTDPDIILVQAQEAIYARSAFMTDIKKTVIPALDKRKGHPVELLPSLEFGTVVIRVQDKNNWWYETYRNQDSLKVAGLH